MKRFTKGCLWTCVICLLLGILLMSVSWALGFRGWHPLRHRSLAMEARNEIVEGEIHSLRLSARTSTLILEEGDHFEILEAAEGTEIESRVEDGVWILEAVGNQQNSSSFLGGLSVDNEGVYWKADMGQVRILVPEDAYFEQVDLETEAGAMELSGLSCKVMTVSSEAGSVNFEAGVEETLEISCHSGGVSGYLDGAEADYGIEADCTLGSITAGSYELGGLIARDSFFHEDEEEKNMILSCELGSIELYFTEE